MPEAAKRFYLCNLIPLWKIDEEDMDVDWPVYNAYFDDLVEMNAEIKNRQIRWATADRSTVDPDLKIRFEVYESDFLFSGGLNDWMGTFSSHSDFGDDVTLRPIKIADDLDDVSEDEREQFIYIQWMEGHEITIETTESNGTTTTRTEDIPDTLRIRCWWRINGEVDVSGNPEFYYDIYVEGKLNDGDELDLHERSDHEMEAFKWYVTREAKRGKVTPIVDGEYVMLKFLQMMADAEHSIHIAAWQMEPKATLAVEAEFKADYLDIPGINEDVFNDLMVRSKPMCLGVAATDGVAYYSASNGNLNAVTTFAPTEVASAAKVIDTPNVLGVPSGLHILEHIGDNIQLLVADCFKSMLHLFMVVKQINLRPQPRVGLLLKIDTFGTKDILIPFYPVSPTLPGVERINREVADGLRPREDAVLAGFIPLAGESAVGWKDVTEPRVYEDEHIIIMLPSGKFNQPSGIVANEDRVFICDTKNHCVRIFKRSSFLLETLAGRPAAGDRDGEGRLARFRFPTGITFDDNADRLLVADSGNRKIRSIEPNSGAVTTLEIGSIDGIEGELGELVGLAYNGSSGEEGTLYVAVRDQHRILAVDLKTRRATTLTGSRGSGSGYRDGSLSEALFNSPLGLSFAAGKLYVADSENRVLRLVDTEAGTVSTFGAADRAIDADVPVVVGDVLRRKTEEGVKVRILLDGFASRETTVNEFHNFHKDIQAFIQNHVQAIEGEFFGTEANQAFASFHDKMMIVDGKMGTTGGVDMANNRNNGIRHVRSHGSRDMFWHDVTAFVEGSAALGLEEHFVRRWKLLRGEFRGQEMAHPPDTIPSPFETVAFFRLPVRHYANEPLVLDARGSNPPAFQEIAEYRWKIFRRHRWFNTVRRGDRYVDEPFYEDDLILDAVATTEMVQVNRRLDAGQYKVKLTVRSSGGGSDSRIRMLDVQTARPDALETIDRTDASIRDHEAESVRTWDPTPIFFEAFNTEEQQILDSYRRAIKAARHYIYLEHQYIFYPELGEMLEEAMREHRSLKIIWVIPFFTEESQDPYQERAQLRRDDRLIESIPDVISAGMGVERQLKGQLSWHGFFHQQEMVNKLRAIDSQRFGVFSLLKLAPQAPRGVMMVYPHSKMILCDDRFFSIGSANANGRGFVTDSEHNISALSPFEGKMLRERLWGEHLGYRGLADVMPDGRLLAVNGHHFEPGAKIKLKHHSLGEVERNIASVETSTGAIELTEGPLDTSLGQIIWGDPTLSTMPLGEVMRMWRTSAHALNVYRKVRGLRATTNSSGHLVVPGNLAEGPNPATGWPGDIIVIGERILEIGEEGSPSTSDPNILTMPGQIFRVNDVAGDIIRFAPVIVNQRESGGPFEGRPTGHVATQRPFRAELVARPFSGFVRIRITLMPNIDNVPFDYLTSYLIRQPGSKRLIRAWEIDPPRGISYAGPGSILRYILLPFVDFDPDEQARLEGLGSNVAFA